MIIIITIIIVIIIIIIIIIKIKIIIINMLELNFLKSRSTIEHKKVSCAFLDNYFNY